MSEQKLDANGQPIVESETVTVPKKQYDEMVQKMATDSQTTSNLVSEIKELRAKKELTETDADALRRKVEELSKQTVVPQDLTPERVAAIASETFKASLAERDVADAKANRAKALTSFLGKHKEFSQDNDPGGIKIAALEKKLYMFNTSGITTEAAFLSVLEDASKLLGNTQPPKGSGFDPNPPAPTGASGGTPPPTVDNNDLSSKELKVIETTFGGDKERYLKQRAKRPDYVETLLRYAI